MPHERNGREQTKRRAARRRAVSSYPPPSSCLIPVRLFVLWRPQIDTTEGNERAGAGGILGGLAARGRGRSHLSLSLSLSRFASNSRSIAHPHVEQHARDGGGGGGDGDYGGLLGGGGDELLVVRVPLLMYYVLFWLSEMKRLQDSPIQGSGLNLPNMPRIGGDALPPRKIWESC